MFDSSEIRYGVEAVDALPLEDSEPSGPHDTVEGLPAQCKHVLWIRVNINYPWTYPVTPDGRYFVVRGQSGRRANPEPSLERVEELIKDRTKARRGLNRRVRDAQVRARARQRVKAAKAALGERGPTYNKSLLFTLESTTR